MFKEATTLSCMLGSQTQHHDENNMRQFNFITAQIMVPKEMLLWTQMGHS